MLHSRTGRVLISRIQEIIVQTISCAHGLWISTHADCFTHAGFLSPTLSARLVVTEVPARLT